jgi:hypothetical protein
MPASLAAFLLSLSGIGLAPPTFASEPAPEPAASFALPAESLSPGERYRVEISLSPRDPALTAEGLRREILTRGGTLQSEQGWGEGKDYSGEIRCTLPLGQGPALWSWLEGAGRITEHRMESLSTEEWSTLRRELDDARALQAVWRRRIEGASTEELPAFEEEVNRLGLVIQEKAAALAALPGPGQTSLVVTLSPAVDESPKTRVHPGFHGSAWVMGEPGGVDTRLGLGLTVAFSRAFSVEVDISPPALGDPSLMLSLGGATYSAHLGNGERRFLNPFLGLRGGWGQVATLNRFLLQGEAGLELLHVHEVILDAWARPSLSFGKDGVSTGVQAGGALTLPF